MSYSYTARLPQRLRSLVESELRPRERIAWLEQPIPGRMALWELPTMVFGIFWTAGSMSWWRDAYKMERELVWFSAFHLPFILIGFGMLSSPYWARRMALRSAYVLTDRRAILFTAGWLGNVTVRSFEAERLTILRCKKHADGSGDLVFAIDTDYDDGSTDVGFLAIRKVKVAEKLVRALKKSKRTIWDEAV